MTIVTQSYPEDEVSKNLELWKKRIDFFAHNPDEKDRYIQALHNWRKWQMRRKVYTIGMVRFYDTIYQRLDKQQKRNVGDAMHNNNFVNVELSNRAWRDHDIDEVTYKESPRDDMWIGTNECQTSFM